ncbi:DUF885 domain-containing protein [Amycolatopsis sp. NPDC051758]|uniref:DUF885 domain-containing protein n=1 Tax=Amycolatopsis sp. NPDC051758 TaxID=3363935 RepID=UPI0037B21BAF
MDTPVHRLCDSYVDDYARLQPALATAIGIPDHDHLLPDLSPDGHAERARLIARTLRAADRLEPADDGERDAKAVLVERLGVDREAYDLGLMEAELSVQTSPARQVRQAFTLMPTGSPEDWRRITARMSEVSGALAGYRESLRAAAARGQVAPARQVRKVAEQYAAWAGTGDEPGFFLSLAGSAVPDAPRAELAAAAAGAGQAYTELAAFLREELLPKAPETDSVGADAYRLSARKYLGADVDLREAYEWAWTEFVRLESEMAEVANRIQAGASVREVGEALDADPRYRITGAAAFRDWAQDLSDRALAELSDTHFEIPAELMRLECRLAPPGSGSGAYYTGPSDDFTRAGAMWWALPQDRSGFTTWRDTSTVYHEGVPGHHLQIATAAHESKRLNKYQRLLASVDAHCEGWARYGELLMRDLGHLSDDGDLMGMLNESLFRTARMITDLGAHLELPIPAGTGFHPGERWRPDLGLEFMLTRTITDPVLVRDGLDRSLGWPAHDLAYRLGERLWLSTRDDARARAGSSFDLKEFHMRALRMGPMGLDTLRERMVAG